MNNKKTMYYLLGSRPIISNEGGDGINEMNQIKFLLNYFDIYYNNQKIDLEKKNFGQNKTIIEIPDNNYDIYYVRNNPEIFLKIPKNKLKLYFGSPYNKRCFEYCDYIVCLTDNWKKMLETPNNNWGILYPENIKYLNTIVLSQKIDPILFYEKNKTDIFKNYNISNTKFKICHFGSFRNSCYPSFIIKLYEHMSLEIKNKIAIIFIGTVNIDFKKKYNKFYYIDNIPLKDINEYINSADLLLYNQRDYQSEYAGSNKIIEAIVCNKPILSVYSKARTDELGENYPLFYKLNYKPSDNPQNHYKDEWISKNEIMRIYNILIRMISDEKYYIDIVNYLKNINKEKFLITYKNDKNIDFILNKIN